MRKTLIIIILICAVILTALGISKTDSGTKQVAGFLDSNILFEYKDGTLTLLNIRLG